MQRLSKNTLGMLIAKYRAVLLRMLRKEVIVLTASGLLLTAPALAAEYHVGAGQAYVTLEALRAAAVDYADGDTVILHQDDASLTAPLDFGGKAVALQGSRDGITLKPSADDIRLFTANRGSAALKSGLIIEGFVNTAAGDAGRGGAIRIENGAGVDARNVTFRDNQSTGGFDSNNVSSGGAAVLVTGAGSRLNADGASFQDNRAATTGGFGGALYIRAGGAATANNAIFSSNSARVGGGVYVTAGSTLSLDNAEFMSNTAAVTGGAGYLGGSVTANGAKFTGNSSAMFAGALYVGTNGVLTADNAQFINNHADSEGGAVYVEGGSFTADGVFFGGNRSAEYGGALHIISPTAGDPAAVTLTNAVFADNQATFGGAVFAGEGGVLTLSNAQFINNTANESKGGAILLRAEVGNGTVNIRTDAGRMTLFSGNRQYVGTALAAANAIAISGRNDNTACLNVDGEGTLDMRDPLNIIVDPTYTYNAAVTKNGAGVWKLGGDSRLANTGGSAGTSFTINAGVLDLYKDAKITLGGGSFTLGDGASLISRGGNTIAAPTLSLGNNSTLGFDLTNAVAGTAALTLTGSTVLTANPAGQYIDILSLNGSGTYNLVKANGISAAGKTLTLRGESFGGTRIAGSLVVNGGDTLQLTVTIQNGVMQWNGGSGDWNTSAESWTGLDTSGVGGTNLSGTTKFLHGDAVVFDNIAGGNIAIQAGGVQVAARPDGSGGNPGLIIKSGDWRFTGGALDGGGIRFAGDGGIAFDSRTLTQRITVDNNVTATIGALDGHTLTFNGMSTGNDGGAIYGGTNAKVILNGGSLNFTGNTARYGGAIYANKTIELSGGANSFTGNQAQYGGAVMSLYGAVTLKDSVNRFSANTATSGWGGAIYADAAVTFNNSDNTFTGNTAGDYGGAIYAAKTFEVSSGSNTFTGNAAINGHGGAISTKTAIFTGGVNRFEGNTAKYTGGAILATDITFDGGDNSFTGNASGTHGGAISAQTVTLSGSGSFTGNKAGLFGGAIYAGQNVSLYARDADIRFEGNRQNYQSAAAPGEANAIFLSNNGGGKTLTLAASAGKSVLFFDPVASSNTMTNLIVSINPGTDNTGSILFDKYQSNIYGSTTVSHGTLALTNGAVYGAAANTGSFTLASGANLRVDAVGGAINAGDVALQNGSTTAVDVSGGKSLTVKGSLEIKAGAVLDITGLTTAAVDAVKSNNFVTGNFTRLTADGQTLDTTPVALQRYRNDGTAIMQNSGTAINVRRLSGLVWNNTAPGIAHGSFDIATGKADTISDSLADNIDTAAHGFGWNGTTLTKTGEGELTLAGGNSYSGGTLIEAGKLVFAGANAAVKGATIIHSGAEMTLANGAVYGATDNSGSFTNHGRLTVGAAGGTINAGAITLENGSATAVDISSGKLLTANASLTIADGAALDLTGYSEGATAVLSSDRAISGSFTSFKIGGIEQTDAMPALDRYINSTFLGKTNDGKTVTVKQGGLVWNNTDDSTAHGTFTIASSYTLGAALADNTHTSAHGFGWNGKTLTKAGMGELTLTGNNTYSGGTQLTAGSLAVGHGSALGSGMLAMADGTTLRFAGDHSLANAVSLSGSAAVNTAGNNASLTGSLSGSGNLTKTGQGNLFLTGSNTYSGGTVISDGRLTVNSLANLGSGGITNNAELYFAPSGSKQTIDFASRYAGSGTLGLNASLTATEQWSDLVKFANASRAAAKIFFTFTAGSDLRYLTEQGLHFAELATADGNDQTFGLVAGTTLAGASELDIKTTDNQNYYLTATFNPSLAKVYSETAVGTLGQAAGMHGQETFKDIGQAIAGAGGGQTGVYAGSGCGDVRHNSGSHADVKGNNFALALAWENGSTTWGLIGQKFDGSYTTTHRADIGGGAQTIHSAGDLKQHDIGLFAEYRPDDSGRYWQGVIKAGKSQNDFRADNANGGSRFRSDRGVFGLSLGGGFVKATAPDRSTETYQHLIYTRLGSDRLTDSLGQDIRFDSDDSVRLLAGLRWKLEREGKPGFYAGAALDYEFRGKTSATIGTNRADSANLQGLTGILELGFSAKQSETLSIDGAVYGYVGKREGISGSLTLTKKF